MAIIYVITVILLITCFVIIEKSLSKESKLKIEKLEKEINFRDQIIISRNENIKGLEFRNKILSISNKSYEEKLHLERNEKEIFIKKEKING